VRIEWPFAEMPNRLHISILCINSFINRFIVYFRSIIRMSSSTVVKTIELVQLNVSEGIEKQVSTLDDILELLTEGPAWIAERSNLINEMRVLQSAHNLLA
jgi:hypothetical protein